MISEKKKSDKYEKGVVWVVSNEGQKKDSLFNISAQKKKARSPQQSSA